MSIGHIPAEQFNISPSSGMEFIEEINPSGVTSITFSNLNLKLYTHLQVKYTGRGTDAASSVNLNMTFNGDIGANYDTERIQAAAATLTGIEALATTNIGITFTSAGGTANFASSAIIDILNYRDTTFQKNTVIQNNLHRTTVTTNQILQMFTASWRSTAAITSITFTLAAGNFLAGSKFSLYGIGPTGPIAVNSPHHTTHEQGGSDAIKLDDLATPDDNTDLDVSDLRHGLVPKLAGAGGAVLQRAGTTALWAAAPYIAHKVAHEFGGLDQLALDASQIASGILPNGRIPNPLPAVSGANLTNLNASALTSGTVPAAQFPVWTSVPFASLTFSTNAGTWTVDAGDVAYFKYMKIGGLVFIKCSIVATTISGGPTELRVGLGGIPLTLTGNDSFGFTVNSPDGFATQDVGQAILRVATNALTFKLRNGAAWPDTTNGNANITNLAGEVVV